MNRLRILLVSAVSSLLFSGAALAGGGGPLLCLDFANFCDGLEVQLNADGSVSGSWVNTDCAGTDVPVGGFAITQNKYAAICSDANCPIGFTWSFVLTALPASFDLWGSDGINPPFLQQVDQPYFVIEGACPFAPQGRESLFSTTQ